MLTPCYRTMQKLRFAAAGVLAIALGISFPLRAQDTMNYLLQQGAPAFSMQDSFQAADISGFVNTANGNLHFEIPLGNYPQRAGGSLPIRLVYDSRVWQVASNGTSKVWTAAGSAGLASWQLLVGVIGPSNPGPTDLSGNDYGVCNSGPFLWPDGDNVLHIFPIRILNTQCPNGLQTVTDADAYSLDASGYHMYLHSAYSATTVRIFSRNGTLVSGPGCGSLNGTIYDTNGNLITGTDQPPNSAHGIIRHSKLLT